MLVGKQLGPFLVEKELGSGAMGAVFRGTDTTTGRTVAIKIIAPSLISNDLAITRFQRESAVLKRLKHPNIARYLGSGRYHGTPFYIMEYLEGESLDKILERRGRVTWEEVVEWGTQLCAALQHAHDEGIIHRDLKPSNVMLQPDGVIKLTDFGIAKDTDAAALTATHSTLGTVAYMSPEQCRGAKDINFKSDLYSLGIMFYELVTGRKPFVADSPMDVFLMHVKGTFARPSTWTMDLPIWLDQLICQLMEKDPDKRPRNATKVAESLEEIARKVQEQVSAGVDRVSKRRGDRTSGDTRLDETDREIGRTLLGKKKKKKSRVPFYAQNWFTLSALGVLVLAALGFVYVVFIKPPSADVLFRQAESGIRSGNLDERKDAREPAGMFLRYYAHDPRADKVREWRDRIDLEVTRWYVANDRRGTDDPSDAWNALADERLGRLDEAAKRWKGLVSLKGNDDRYLNGWGLLAEKSLKDIEQAGIVYRDLILRLSREVDPKAKEEPRTEAERLALDAMRSHAAQDRSRARRSLEDLKRLTENQDDYQPYYLLALKLTRDLQ